MDSEHPGVPQRPPAYAHLLIDSKDREPSRVFDIAIATPANNFIINRNQALLNGYFTRLAITQLEFNYRLPTVISNTNDVFYLDICGAAPPLIIQPYFLIPGYYTPTQLAAMVQARLQAVAATAAFTCVWSDTTASLQISSNNPATSFVFINPDQLAQAGLTSTGGALYTRVSRTNRLLGVTSSNTGISAPLNDFQRLASPKMLYTNYVDIVSRNLTKYQRVKDIDTAPVDTKSFIIARLYFCPPGQRILDLSGSWSGSAPFDICVDYNTPKQIRWSPNEAIFQLDLEVLDEYGQRLYWDELVAPWEYQLTLVASET